MEITKIATVELMKELARRANCEKKPEKRTIFFGPPGCGKGTQAPLIKEEFCLCHLSTGDMLRAAVKAGSEMGIKAKVVMDAGKLVGDDIVVGLVSEAIEAEECRKGFILDGFPRTIPQAKMLDAMLATKKVEIDSVVSLEIADDLLVKRITGRMIHSASGRSYNIYFNPPKIEGKDDLTGDLLVKRGDDTEDKLKARLNEFHTQTIPLLKYYGKKVAHIKADEDINVITDKIRASLNK